MVTVKLTPAQARMVNTALAREEAEAHDIEEGYRPDVMERTRQAVWAAMVNAGVEP